ncbi:tautomerase family protein [Streptomyces sp. NPDC002764]|jgi:phenylpyruvate tautomerase PptA (4-oxalocrotonate tautomerase family)|uniref:tautomerase family protein n=1 Tax=Streptomyces sp. NPDC002764 TaxID=3154428 RepID=UPI003333400B
MPLVKISLRSGRPAEYVRAVGRSVHRAMVETINVPEADEFQIITENSAAEIVYHPTFLGIQRTDGIVIVQIYLGVGRTIEQKQTLYSRMVELLKDDPGIAPADVFINLVETPMENWSLGNGAATFVR